MPKDYIPRPDGDFAAFSIAYYAALDAWWTKQKLNPDDLLALKDALDEWATCYAAHTAAQAAAQGARAAKDDARRALEALIRPITRSVQGYPATTNADRAAIGISERDTGNTPSPTPTSAPQATIESGQRLTHRLRFTDAAAPTRRGKPPGTIGAEVWLALTSVGQPAPPLGDSYKFLSVSSRGKLQNHFPSSEAGKTAYYALRWVSTRGEKGPWSEVCCATVAA